MINNQLDLDRWRRELAQRGRAQIADFLQADAAERLHHCLAHEVPWQTAEITTGIGRTTERGVTRTPEQERELLEAAYRLAGDQYQFVYDSYMLVRAAQEGWDENLLVRFVLEFFNSPQYLAFVRHLTGDSGIHSINAQATRFRPGQFLQLHQDISHEEDWRYAYVLNLTREWRADWGGLLHFVDDSGAVVDTLLPRWNTLSLFKVPAHHFVSLVAPWAKQPRLAITGWFRGLPPRSAEPTN